MLRAGLRGRSIDNNNNAHCKGRAKHFSSRDVFVEPLRAQHVRRRKTAPGDVAGSSGVAVAARPRRCRISPGRNLNGRLAIPDKYTRRTYRRWIDRRGILL
jgi:hypothetical protein